MKRTKIASGVFVTQVKPHRQHIVESIKGFLVRADIDEEVIRFTSILSVRGKTVPNYFVIPRGSYKTARAAYDLHMRLAENHRIDWSTY